MNRLIQFAIAYCFSLVVFAANPSFQSFNTTQFDVTGNRVAITNGAIITNLVVAGAEANLLEVLDEDSVLRFYIDPDGLLGIAGALTSSAGQTATAFILDTATNHTSGNLLEVKNQGTNKFVVPWDGAVSVPGSLTAYDIAITNELNVHGSIKANTLIVTNNVSFYNNTYVSNFFATAATITNDITVQGNYIGTIDPTVTGTTLKLQKSLKLQFPRLVDNAGCTYSNTNDYTALTFMLPQFSGTGATNANYCDFAFRVPADLDTSKDLTASLAIRLTGADTSGHTYDVGMVSIANSGAAAGTPANYVALTISGDGSGASGDIESVSNVTLTSWRSNMTAGQWCLLRLNRDGANDASTVASNLMELEIFYWATQ